MRAHLLTCETGLTDVFDIRARLVQCSDNDHRCVTIPVGRMVSHRDHSDVAQASDTGLPVFADSVAASARRRASIASSMDGVGLVPVTTASMNSVSSMR